MHLPTHILSGWCVANCFELTARQRLFCMIAATAPDVDGLSRVFGEEAYWDAHHVLGHNLLFCVIVATTLAAMSPQRAKSFAIYLLLGHLHLLMDYFGSGPGWGIAYLWPISRMQLKTDLAWEFFSWQNLTTAAALLLWTIWIAIRYHHTPIELIAPDLDRRICYGTRPAALD